MTTHPDAATATTSFLVIRHAESEANVGGYFASQSDSPLTAAGRAQAARLADALGASAVTTLYSSDLTRALETARPLALARGLEVTVSPLLREREMGTFTGQTFAQVRAAHPELWAQIIARAPDAAPEGGESPRALAARVARFVDGLCARHPGETVAIVSHGGTIQHLVRQLLGVTDLAVPLWVHSSNAAVTRIDLVASAASGVSSRLAYCNRFVPDEDRPLFG